MSNSVDPDETAHYEPSHLDLRCLQQPTIIACGSERDKAIFRAWNLALKSTAPPITHIFLVGRKVLYHIFETSLRNIYNQKYCD